MSLLLTLFIEFFQIGLFAIGGGMATIPFLSNLITKFGWFDAATLTDMIAISESTPGPIGVNMATFTGYTTSGILGGVVATLGLVTPSIIVIVIIAQFLKKFKESPIIQSMFYGLRPAVAGLIAAAGFTIFTVSLFNVPAFEASGNLFELFDLLKIVIFIVIFYLTRKYDRHPIFYISLCAIIGIIFQL